MSNTDEFGLDVPFYTAVEARRHILSKSQSVIDVAAKLATGSLPARDYHGDIDVLRQFLTLVGKLKAADDPIVIPSTVLKRLKETPKNCQIRLEELFISFLDGEIGAPQLKSILEGYSYLFEMNEIREIADLLREQKTKFGRR